MKRIKIWILRTRLRHIEKRLAEIDKALRSAGEYQAQELRGERSDLLYIRAGTQRELDRLIKAPTAEALADLEQRRRTIDAWAREQEEGTDRFIAKLEAEGDYRQARIHRVHKLGIRERLEEQLAPPEVKYR